MWCECGTGQPARTMGRTRAQMKTLCALCTAMPISALR